MKVYISGPITGHENYMAEFAAAEERVKQQFKDVEIISPARTNATLPKSTTYWEYMNICYQLLDMSDAIYMMAGWKNSSGACIEYGYARAKDMILFNSEEEKS